MRVSAHAPTDIRPKPCKPRNRGAERNETYLRKGLSIRPCVWVYRSNSTSTALIPAWNPGCSSSEGAIADVVALGWNLSLRYRRGGQRFNPEWRPWIPGGATRLRKGGSQSIRPATRPTGRRLICRPRPPQASAGPAFRVPAPVRATPGSTRARDCRHPESDRQGRRTHAGPR